MCDSMVDGNTVESFVGVKVVIPFRVALCENTTLNERARHRVTKVDGTNRSKIKENCIIFSNVKKSDEGTYKITCHDNNVIEGEFKLNVSVGMLQSNAISLIIIIAFNSASVCQYSPSMHAYQKRRTRYFDLHGNTSSIIGRIRNYNSGQL